MLRKKKLQELKEERLKLEASKPTTKTKVQTIKSSNYQKFFSPRNNKKITFDYEGNEIPQKIDQKKI